MTEQQQIAQTILEQLGGRRFIIMTGANTFTTYSKNGCNGVAFRLGRNASKANLVNIVLTPEDLYRITFSRLRKFEITPLKEFDGIYCDQLEEIFTETTGLYTRL